MPDLHAPVMVHSSVPLSPWSIAHKNSSLPASLLLVMACPCRVLLLLMGAFLVVSQPTLVQPDALLVFPGQVAQLSCTLSPQHTAIRDYGVSWYQQQPGSAPRLLLYYYSKEDHYRPAEIPDRFSAAKDEAYNTCVLTISPVQPEDEADYYCSVGYSFGP